MVFKAVKGCEDFYPQDFAQREAVFEILRRVTKSYGFVEVSTPAMETTELLTKKSGEEIKQQLFVLEKKGAEENALRFDLTVPMARLFISKQKELPKPVKWFGLERMWRYEAPQKGRLREFYQLSVELFGSDKPEADAEVINVALDCLKAFGLTAEDVTLKLNNRKLLEGMVGDITGKELVETVIRLIDKRSKISDNEFVDSLLEAGLDQQQAEKVDEISSIRGTPAEVLTRLLAMQLCEHAKKGLDELEAVLPMLPQEFVMLDLSLARGLAYYTGNVFEVFDRKGELRAILGGGRYDEMVSLFGGEKEAATGFGLGYATLSLLLAQKGKMPKTAIGPDYYIIGLGVKETEKARQLADSMRKRGIKVEMDLLGRKLDKQMKYANVVGAKKLVVIGPQELATGVVKIKDMTTGNEESKRLEEM
jgi:histidyl-tRNA synthetase